MLGAPSPRRIDVDMEVNASASFRRGFRSLHLFERKPGLAFEGARLEAVAYDAFPTASNRHRVSARLRFFFSLWCSSKGAQSVESQGVSLRNRPFV